VICYRRQGVPTVRMTKSQCKGLARGSRARGTVSRGPLVRPVNVTTVTTFLGTKAVSLARAWKQSVGSDRERDLAFEDVKSFVLPAVDVRWGTAARTTSA